MSSYGMKIGIFWQTGMDCCFSRWDLVRSRACVCGVYPAKFKDLRLQRALCLDSYVISYPVKKILRRGLYTVWEKLWYFYFPLIFSFLECHQRWVSCSEVQMKRGFWRAIDTKVVPFINGRLDFVTNGLKKRTVLIRNVSLHSDFSEDLGSLEMWICILGWLAHDVSESPSVLFFKIPAVQVELYLWDGLLLWGVFGLYHFSSRTIPSKWKGSESNSGRNFSTDVDILLRLLLHLRV